MQAKQPETPARTGHTTAGEATLPGAIRDYVRAYALWHGRPQAARHFGVFPPHPVALPGNGDTWAAHCPGRWSTPSAATPTPSRRRPGP